MAIEKVNIDQFLQLAQQHPVLDVRSPGEYVHARIPGAHAFPLFTDEERKIVGTTYKQQSREAAIKVGLEFFGPKMRRMVEEAEGLAEGVKLTDAGKAVPNKNAKTVLVHCWRGGMRSGGVAWLLDLYGFKVYTLVGGYKLFRRWVLNQLERDWCVNILGGFTGSGKTEILRQLNLSGERVIDLEFLAQHKGSAFGNIGLPEQPSQEMFENLLAVQLHFKNSQGEPIWLEDESQRIGRINIPQTFWLQMRKAKVYFMDIPFGERLKHITEEYGTLDKEKMIAAIERIQKRLGGLEAKTTIQLIADGKMEEAFRILLKYYDKWYLKGLNNRNNVEELSTTMKLSTVDAVTNAKLLLSEIKKNPISKNLINEPGYR